LGHWEEIFLYTPLQEVFIVALGAVGKRKIIYALRQDHFKENLEKIAGKI